MGDSLGQGDLGNVVPTLNQDLHKRSSAISDLVPDPRSHWRAEQPQESKLRGLKLTQA